MTFDVYVDTFSGGLLLSAGAWEEEKGEGSGGLREEEAVDKTEG